MTNQRFSSVWDAIEDTPEDAAKMKFRSQLMIQLNSYVVRRGLSEGDAARALGITQPRFSELVGGKINLFFIEELLNMAAAAGLHIQVDLQPALGGPLSQHL